MPNQTFFTESTDNFLTHKVSEHTKQKLYYLQHYLSRFVVSMRNKNWRAINYIDPFCASGKGKTESGEIILGSPLLALSQKSSFDSYYFSDNDPEKISALKDRCKSHPDFSKIIFKVDDGNARITQIAQEITDSNKVWMDRKWSALNLAFLDPYGLELKWQSVEALAKLRTDMIIYYSQMGITREAPKEINTHPPTLIDMFFGGTEWREIYKKYQSREEYSLHRSLLDYYKNNLARFGYQVEDPIPEPKITNSKDAPMYRLLFVSKHPLGNKFWSEINTRKPDGQIRMNLG